MSDHLQNQSKRNRSFAVLSTIGLAVYLLAWGVLHAYTPSTVLFPILIADLLSKVRGRAPADPGSGLGYFAVLVASFLSGVLFATMYWSIETCLVRAKFPNKVRAGRLVAAFFFFVVMSP